MHSVESGESCADVAIGAGCRLSKKKAGVIGLTPALHFNWKSVSFSLDDLWSKRLEPQVQAELMDPRPF
jgi:hypothetical protein